MFFHGAGITTVSRFHKTQVMVLAGMQIARAGQICPHPLQQAPGLGKIAIGYGIEDSLRQQHEIP